MAPTLGLGSRALAAAPRSDPGARATPSARQRSPRSLRVDRIGRVGVRPNRRTLPRGIFWCPCSFHCASTTEKEVLKRGEMRPFMSCEKRTADVGRSKPQGWPSPPAASKRYVFDNWHIALDKSQMVSQDTRKLRRDPLGRKLGRTPHVLRPKVNQQTNQTDTKIKPKEHYHKVSPRPKINQENRF